jgi:D-3-phosphoglycerate dehydrogenase
LSIKERRTKVLLLPPPPEIQDPWQRDVIEAVDSKHDLIIYSRSAPLVPQFQGIDVVVDFGASSRVTREMADAAYSVKLWQTVSTGFEHLEIEYWRQKNITSANCPGKFSATALAECALMFMLMLARRWHTTQSHLKSGIFYTPSGSELRNRNLGLIGFGASASELARRASVFGMRISAIDIREVSSQERREFGLEFVGNTVDIDKVVSSSDYLSLHLHLNSQTRHIIDARRLQLMKPTACLINVARGALVDEQALYEALRDGRLAGAGLDVFCREPIDPESPLLKLSNVVATPHISGATGGTSRRRATCVAKNVDRIAAGLEPLHRIA